jgi:hypothetical protein
MTLHLLILGMSIRLVQCPHLQANKVLYYPFLSFLPGRRLQLHWDALCTRIFRLHRYDWKRASLRDMSMAEAEAEMHSDKSFCG